MSESYRVTGEHEKIGKAKYNLASKTFYLYTKTLKRRIAMRVSNKFIKYLVSIGVFFFFKSKSVK